MAIEILSPGALTTVQDGGRIGYASIGFRRGGACDSYAFALGNLLVGNPWEINAAALEMTLSGAALRFTEDTVFALMGADMAAVLDGTDLPPLTPAFAKASSTLKLGIAKAGLRGYLAVYGGVAAPLTMGSRSTDSQCGIGGMAGRALQTGDVLPVGKSGSSAAAFWAQRRQKLNRLRPLLCADDGFLCRASRPWRFVGNSKIPLLRAVPGPQEEAFTADDLRAFVHEVYTVTADSNRMACKLAGAALEMAHGADILSDGIVCGSVQVSANGQPIVMLADHQTTGGYAKIATVISTDIASMAQIRPGEKVAFSFVTPQQAVAAARAEARKLTYIKECLE